MIDAIRPEKDDEHERPVSSAWRQAFSDIVEALRKRNYRLTGIHGVQPIDDATARGIEQNIEAYGGTLLPLPDETWQTSVCQWQSSHWEVLVDLFTAEEGRADLVLHVNVFESADDFLFKVHFVYVP